MLDILSIILKIVFIVFFFGFCVFIHEFGHLIAALWQGLHVEKFSIGMGPKICGFRYRNVDFVISWLPFGGYVSLPQLDPTDNPTASDQTPLPVASAKARAITAFAGPLFNIIFGFVLATIMWGVGLWEPAKSTSVVAAGVPAYLPVEPEGLGGGNPITAIDGKAIPQVGGVKVTTWAELCYSWSAIYPEAQSLPEEIKLTVQVGDGVTQEVTVKPTPNPEWVAGLRDGDRIVAVNGRSFTRGADAFQKEYVYSNTAHLTLDTVRNGEKRLLAYTPAPNPMMEGLGFPFFAAVNPIQVGAVQPGSPAAAAGLKEGDQLLALGSRNIMGARDFAEMLPEFAGKTAKLLVSRQGKTMELGDLAIPAENPTETALGISFYVLAIEVLDGSPAKDAGIRYGDQFLRVETLDAEGKTVADTKVIDTKSFIEAVRSCEGRQLRLTCRRGDQEFTTTMTPRKNDTVTPAVYQVGVVLSDGLSKVIGHPTPWAQFTNVMTTTCRTLGLLFSPITSRVSSVVTGRPRDTPQAQIGLKHMSGPLGILQALWYKLQLEGYRSGFAFIILITFSLAFMNLLPLPVLDGGHIVVAGLEGVTRRRMPAKVLVWIYNIFTFLLIALMLYITVFDGRRVYKYATHGKSAPQTQQQTDK